MCHIPFSVLSRIFIMFVKLYSQLIFKGTYDNTHFFAGLSHKGVRCVRDCGNKFSAFQHFFTLLAVGFLTKIILIKKQTI